MFQPRQKITVTATKADGRKVSFETLCRIDTPVEVEYYRHGGILHKVLRELAKAESNVAEPDVFKSGSAVTQLPGEGINRKIPGKVCRASAVAA